MFERHIQYLNQNRWLYPLFLSGYTAALALPLILGAFQGYPEFFSGYYLIFCLPLVTFIRRSDRSWWILPPLVCFPALQAWYLYTGQYTAPYQEARIILALFFALYLCILGLSMRKPDFDSHSGPDFLLSCGLPLATGIIFLHMTKHDPPLFVLSLAGLGIFCGTAAWIACRVLKEKNGRNLIQFHWIASFLCLNACPHFLLESTVALALYCAEALLLFWWSGHENRWRQKAVIMLFLVFLPCYAVLEKCRLLPAAACLALAFLLCAFLQNKEMRRTGKYNNRHARTSPQELFLLLFGLICWFGGPAFFIFHDLPSPGLVFFIFSSTCAYFLYVLGKLFRFRSLCIVIFLPIFVSIPAAVLPFLYQLHLEWPTPDRILFHNYLSGLGAPAWGIFFIMIWVTLRRNWGGLVSNRLHAWILGLVSLELILVLTSSCRAFALENGVFPSLLSTLAALPSLGYIIVLSRWTKSRLFFRPHIQITLVLIPSLLFASLIFWFALSLGIPGKDAPWGSYLPLLNPTELTQIACIITFGFWQRRLGKVRPPVPHLSEGQRISIYWLFAFFWLHGLAFRVLQYFSQAEVGQVAGFVELHFIFACLWVLFGILGWRGGTGYASNLAWGLGFLLFLAGSGLLILTGLKLWGNTITLVLGLMLLGVCALIFWQSPAPFTARGRKFSEN